MLVHAHETIWKEGRLLTLGNKDVKHAEEILQLLEAVELLNQVSIIHCPGHQRDSYQTSQGNQTADKAGSQAARELPRLGVLILCLDLSKFRPLYTKGDEEWDCEWGFTNIYPNSIWKINTQGTILLPEVQVYPILKHLYEGTHYGRDALRDLIRSHLKSPHLQRAIQRITQACQVCAKDSPKTQHIPAKKCVQCKGLCSLEDWQVDFTPMPKTRGNFKFLLFFCGHFFGWVEVYPTRIEKVTKVAELLLKEIIHKFGLPHNVQNDNGPSFTLEISQKVGQSWKIRWKLHASWRPQIWERLRK